MVGQILGELNHFTAGIHPIHAVSVSSDLQARQRCQQITWSGVSQRRQGIAWTNARGFYSYLGRATSTTDDFRQVGLMNDSVGPPATISRKIPTGLVTATSPSRHCAAFRSRNGQAASNDHRRRTACTEDGAQVGTLETGRAITTLAASAKGTQCRRGRWSLV